MTNTYCEGSERAEAQAGTQLASIAELVTCLEHAQTCDNTACGADCTYDENEAREAITGDVLSIEVRTDWHTVGADQYRDVSQRALSCGNVPAVAKVS
jgi:hypothetical protein